MRNLNISGSTCTRLGVSRRRTCNNQKKIGLGADPDVYPHTGNRYPLFYFSVLRKLSFKLFFTLKKLNKNLYNSSYIFFFFFFSVKMQKMPYDEIRKIKLSELKFIPDLPKKPFMTTESAEVFKGEFQGFPVAIKKYLNSGQFIRWVPLWNRVISSVVTEQLRNIIILHI